MSCFNDTGEPRTLLGNWQEERVLKDAVGTARLTNVADRALNTTERVLSQAAHVGVPESTAHDVHNYTKHARAFEGVPLGPRARATQARLRAACNAEAAAEMEAKRSAVDNRRYLTTTIQANYAAPDADSLAAAATGRRRMKTQDGRDLPAGCRDMEWAASEGIAKPPVRSLAPAQAEALAGDVPVTFWSSRLAEGVVPASQTTNAQHPFHRSVAFSTTVDLRGRQPRPSSAEPNIGLAMAAAPGTGAALGSLFARVRAALESRRGPAVWDDLTATLSRWDKNQDACIGLNELRSALQGLGLALPERELLALFLSMDSSGDGKLSVAEAVAALRGDADSELGLATGHATAHMTGTLTAAEQLSHSTRGWADLYAAGVARPAGAAAAEALGGFGTGAPTLAAARTSKVPVQAPRTTGGAGAALGGVVPPGHALLHVRHNDGTEEDVVVPDPVGFTPSDGPAMRVALRHANVHHVHHVSLVSRG